MARWADGHDVTCEDWSLGWTAGLNPNVSVETRTSYSKIKKITWDSKTPQTCRVEYDHKDWSYDRDLPLLLPAHLEKNIFEKNNKTSEGYDRNSTYVVFPESTMSETEFIRALAQRTGCGLLLDVNNVFVSATNHGYSALTYLADFPLDHVGEIHLAGHATQADDEGDLLLIDSHDGPVANAVWILFEIVIGQCGPIPTLVEWDSAIPDWPILKAEAIAAQKILDHHVQGLMSGRANAAR